MYFKRHSAMVMIIFDIVVPAPTRLSNPNSARGVNKLSHKCVASLNLQLKSINKY